MNIAIHSQAEAERRVTERIKSFKSTLAYSAPEVEAERWAKFERDMVALVGEVWSSSEYLHMP